MAVKQFPEELARYITDLYRIVLEAVGLDVDLYVPKAKVDAMREDDIYGQKPEKEFIGPFRVKAYINWQPDLYRLKKMGLYVETAPPPLLAYVQFKEIDWLYSEYKGVLPIGSYIVVPIEFLPSGVVNTEFEVVNVRTPHLHGQIECLVLYDLAPRRAK